MSWLPDFKSGLGWFFDKIASGASWLFSAPTWIWAGIKWICGLGVVLWTMTEKCTAFIIEKFTEIQAFFSQMGVGEFAATVGTAAPILEGINTFFPLQEVFARIASFLALMFVCYKLRILKSFIPGIG